MNSDIVNQLFKFCKIYQDCDKQYLITTDADYDLPFQSKQSTTVSQFVFETFGTEHWCFRTQRVFTCSCGFLAFYSELFWLLMYPLKWSHASFVKANSQSHKRIVKNSCWRLQDFRATGSQQNWNKTANLCRKDQQMLWVSTATEGQPFTAVHIPVCTGVWSLGCVLYRTLCEVKCKGKVRHRRGHEGAEWE